MYYNGQNGDGHYSIGRAVSWDGIHWERTARRPLLTPGSGWEDSSVHGPDVVSANGVTYLYYAGYDGRHWQIGVATSSNQGRTYTKYSGNPIVRIGGFGQPDSAGVWFPTVMYDKSDPNPGKRWKMWYDANDGKTERIAYAYSANGLSWTKAGVVLRPSRAAWESNGVGNTGSVRKLGHKYYLYYSGNELVHGRSRWTEAMVTFSDPQGAYVRCSCNPLLSGALARVQRLTADAKTGARVLTVRNTAVFRRGEEVEIADKAVAPQLTRVSAIESPRRILLQNTIRHTLAVARRASVRSVYSWSITSRTFPYQQRGRYVMPITVYQQFSDMGYLTEFTAFATAPALVGPWKFDVARGVALPPDPSHSPWDTISAENAAVVTPG